MVKYDPENAQAWAVIMKKVHALRAKGKTMQQIGNTLGVGRDTVSRWISQEFGGEKTTFGDMLRYAKALDISFDELMGKPRQTATVTPYNKTVGRILEEFAHDSDMTITDIAQEARLPAVDINAVFAGEAPATPDLLYGICTAIEVNTSMVLKRAARQLEKEIEDDNTAIAERTA